MASFRLMAAALAATHMVGQVQAWTVELPPCLSPFQPFVYSGCYDDNGSPHTLAFRSSLDQQNMTVETCVAECKGNGYRYAGLEYYGVCFCGGTVIGSPVDESLCNYPCTGNKSENCGGNNIISIYQDPTYTPFEDVTVQDYAPLGCWTDDSPYGRALGYPQDQLNSQTLTTSDCLNACKDGGFPFAGTEYGGECWCSATIGNDTGAAPDFDCNMPCNGDSTEICGGRSRLNLYVAKELESLQPCGYVPPVSSSASSTLSTSTSSIVVSSVPPLSTTSSTTSSSIIPSSTTSSTTSSTASITISSTTSSTISSTTSSTTTSKSSTTSCTTTTKPPTTTSSTSSTKTSSVCVATVTVPATCEYKCGNWCSSPIPDWKDVPGCKNGQGSCKLQVASCFKSAGWPGSLNCFDFAGWCSDLNNYCSTAPAGGCSKGGFRSQKPPKNPQPPTTTVITTACGVSSTAKPTSTSTSQVPIPTPTNICIQPTNKQWGYGPGNPAGGIELPIVTCNDLSRDWTFNPFKLYTEPRSSDCKSYPRTSCTSACADACREQYDNCVGTYVKGCEKRRDDVSYFDFVNSVEKRTYSFQDSPSTANSKCRAQYTDCLTVNRDSRGVGKCSKFGVQ
ncbi:WSC domain-containing protein [Podospora appendiculata]|uniref:WSC domain-containing protein n=1 Tax=Podospora appendiculata TaxID=314037 RepID=A0AAE0XGW3_9PEZI|nr:WSC domain-containing protein [Podospora appendiculata]